MKISNRLIEIEEILRTKLDYLINNLSQNSRNRMRVLFKNGAVLDIRYPVESEYSFNLRFQENIYRIDTAPHHVKLNSYPNHFHNEEEENVITDSWTNPEKSISFNINAICDWISEIFESNNRVE